MTKANLITIENGGVSSANGFAPVVFMPVFAMTPTALNWHCRGRRTVPCCWGVYSERVRAAPVTVSREHLDGVGYGFARAMVINSGIANAATGSVDSRMPARLPASLP